MAAFVLLFLILVDGLLGVAMADTSTQPAPSPSNYGKSYHADEAPVARKLGKHWPKVIEPSGNLPLLAPQPGTILQSVEESSSAGPAPSSVDESGQGQEFHLEMRHRYVDKSIAGGGGILGGLAATFLVAVFCYIRATRRHKLKAQSTSSEISS